MAVVFVTLRRLVGGSSLQALALFLPFLATSFFMKLGPPDNRYSPASLFSLFPIRYAGPYLLLWLLVRRVDSGATRRPLALLALAGLVVINNPEFGVPALGATLAGARCGARRRARGARSAGWRRGARRRRDRRGTRVRADARRRRVAAALRACCSTFPRIFGTEGFGLLPMPSIGFHLVVYLDVRGRDRRRDRARAGGGDDAPADRRARLERRLRARHRRLLHRPLAPARADRPLLALVARARAARDRRRAARSCARPVPPPALAELLVLAGLGTMACSLAQIADAVVAARRG